MSVLIYKQRHRHPNRKDTPGANYAHVRYIATRPGVMKNNCMEHGLFGKMQPGGLECFSDWRDVAKKAYAAAKQGHIMYRSVVSFARQTAKELLLEDQKSWQKYIENHILTIAGKNNIRREDLKWAAAVHDEKAHPHIHVVFWDSSSRVRSPFTPPQIPDAIRKQMIKDTFSEKILAFAQEKGAAVRELRQITDEFVAQFENVLRCRILGKYRNTGRELGEELETDVAFSEEMLQEFARRMESFRRGLPEHGRLSYQLLAPQDKARTDELAEFLLAEVPELRYYFDRYVEAKCKMASLYASDGAAHEKQGERFMQEAKKILGNRVLAGVKMLNRLEQEAKTAEYRESRREYYASIILMEALDMLAQAARREEDGYSACVDNKGELSRDARKELFLKNQDKGYEH
ncbi:MAG: hypothetical protein HDR14_13890 [Lachnospiraceae bacterium]|nr:hypothetical protein [Lachnospiraceae bacterium]